MAQMSTRFREKLLVVDSDGDSSAETVSSHAVLEFGTVMLIWIAGESRHFE